MSRDELRARLASVVGGADVVYGEEIVGLLEQPPPEMRRRCNLLDMSRRFEGKARV